MSLDQRPAQRASDLDRDAVLVRLHTAFADGRIDEAELDERIERTLRCRTTPELALVAADLPAHAPAAPGARVAGRFQLAWKSVLRRSGRYPLPPVSTVVVYKGRAVLDLTAAEYGDVARLRVVAYKSRVDILVPPGVRVESGGAGVSTDLRGDAPPRTQCVRVQGLAYKGTIEVTDLPPSA
ncbi:DUF1707 SHOCT-like domain-containing protein [Actinomadura flavalba]|uniref:DUF1707 SHOCT-like domain-containing protein n=1 Tax=Actinomadura flavalba TaxID=1120938 RepID=UPI00036FDE73|nr:DUF1707 domain-containing protein [Actinomadura flavalba]